MEKKLNTTWDFEGKALSTDYLPQWARQTLAKASYTDDEGRIDEKFYSFYRDSYYQKVQAVSNDKKR